LLIDSTSFQWFSCFLTLHKTNHLCRLPMSDS
jgi:hypothetical protein